MREMRDSQRSRVYAAENTVYRHKQTIPNDKLQATVDAILDKRVIRSRWGIKSVRVEFGRSRGVSYGGMIALGVGARNEWVICHELAHELTPHQYASHGPEFCGIYLFLVENVIGKEAAAKLRAAFKAGRVKVNRAGIPAVREDVPKPREERLRAIRAKNRELALEKVRQFLSRGQLTKADLRRLAA